MLVFLEKIKPLLRPWSLLAGPELPLLVTSHRHWYIGAYNGSKGRQPLGTPPHIYIQHNSKVGLA